MGIPMLVFWGLVIWGIVALVRVAGQTSSQTRFDPNHDPEQVLADRFARGEIDADEYRARLATLRETTRTTA
jgi:putative membrane protein